MCGINQSEAKMNVQFISGAKRLKNERRVI